MLVEPEAGLAVGDDLKLVIYGRAGIDPAVVRAKVIRDQGVDGLGIAFCEVSSDAAVGIRNVDDRDPPVSPAYGFPNWSFFNYDIFGRVPYIRYEQDL